jgi:flavin-dependent dehydrogenase
MTERGTDHARVLGQRVIIVGGSIAGLLAARALSPFFASVVVVERDDLPAAPAWR